MRKSWLGLKHQPQLQSSPKNQKVLVAGTLAETSEAKSRWGVSLNNEQRRGDEAFGYVKAYLSFEELEEKIDLSKNKSCKSRGGFSKSSGISISGRVPTDVETVTDEERFLFRRIGLKMKAFLMLGKREVFDGTVQNMHLHWKHRELVKIIVKGKNFAQVKRIAISLEAESEGVLISLDKTSKGYAIIFYRGKNYRRPQILKPRNLLTRRQALARSVELQMREALKHHISSLQDKIWKLKSQFVQMKSASEKQDVKLLQTVEDDLSSDDDEVEVMMFSATLSKEIRPVCKKFMQDIAAHSMFTWFFFVGVDSSGSDSPSVLVWLTKQHSLSWNCIGKYCC